MVYGNARLRPIKEEDLELLLSWRKSERIHKNLFTDHLIKPEEHHLWFRRQAERKDVSLMFEICGQPSGFVGFTDFDLYNGKCYWGFYLGKTGLPRGSGLLMGYLALQLLFSRYDVKKLSAQAFTYNHKSINYHFTLGFLIEGLLKKEIKKDGNYQDVLLFSLFNDAWQRHRENVEGILEAFKIGEQ